MIFGSVCSGIEAASVAWHPLGWRAAFLSEIEAFPRSVLTHHFPDVPLHGDFTTIEAGQYDAIDLLVGGTPCQSFSIAGLRGGLADDRGNLTLEFLRLADRLQPRWIVWENVPGVISDRTDALTTFLDGLESLGYVVDIDILDAQFFGLAQRRRRVFVCGQKASSILKQKTLSSGLTIAQCLVECLRLSLAVLSGQSIAVSESWAFDASKPAHSLRRRMTLFGLDKADAAPILHASLAALRVSSECEQSDWALENGSQRHPTTEDTKSSELKAATDWRAAFLSIAPSWNATLAAALAVMNECITSTATSGITESKIFICAQATAHIAALITQSMESSPCFWSAASSTLIALEAFTDYARQASSDLFTGLEWLQPWRDFVRQADAGCVALRRFGIGSAGEIFPLADSLQGHSPPRREKREVVAALTADGVGTCGADDNQGQAGHLLAASTGNVPHCLNAGGMGRQDFETETLIAHALRGEGFDASEDGTGRRTPIIPVAFSSKDHGADAGETSPTLRAGGHSKSHANAGVPPAVAFDLRGREGGAQFEGPHDSANIRAASGGSSRSYVASTAVRRLTPMECERLQGFPDDWTLVPHRGKPAADGPRYKALGNSMAIPVVRWLGERIQKVEDLCSPAKTAA